jgi:hypothetical protein
MALRGVSLAGIGAKAMTRSHRLAHRLMWPILALAIGLGFAMAFYLRLPPDAPEPTVAAEPRR